MKHTIIILLLPLLLLGCDLSNDYSQTPSRSGVFGQARQTSPTVYQGLYTDIIDCGNMPGPNTITAPQFFSQHPVDANPSLCNDSFCFLTGLIKHNSFSTNQKETIFYVGAKAKANRSIKRPPTDFYIISNMDADNGLTTSMEGFMENLSINDRVFLIDYRTLSDNKKAIEPTLIQASLSDPTQFSNSIPISPEMESAAFEHAFSMMDASENRHSHIIYMVDNNDSNENIILKNSETIISANASEHRQVSVVGLGQNIPFKHLFALTAHGGMTHFPMTVQDMYPILKKMAFFYSWPAAKNISISLTHNGDIQFGTSLGVSNWNEEVTASTINFGTIYSSNGTFKEDVNRSQAKNIFHEQILNYIRITSTDESLKSGNINLNYDHPQTDSLSTFETSLLSLASNGMVISNQFYSDTSAAQASFILNLYVGFKNVFQLGAMYRFDASLGLLEAIIAKSTDFKQALKWENAYLSTFTRIYNLRDNLAYWAQLYPSDYGSDGLSFDEDTLYSDEWVYDWEEDYWENYWENCEWGSYDEDWYDDEYYDDDYWYEDDYCEDDYYDDGEDWSDDEWSDDGWDDDGWDDDGWDDDGWDDDGWDDDGWDDDDWK
jgi:hypothetical protein